MKRLSLLILCALSIAACKKESTGDDRVIIEPPQVRIVSNDTLKAGQKMGIAIGMPAATVYAQIQQVKTQERITYVNVVDNVLNSIDDLQGMLPLYQNLFLDEKPGSGTGVQFTFADNRVKEIWTNDGVKLGKWPGGTASNATVTVGDAVGDIYQKLLNIKQISAYTNKFQYIGIFTKNLDKGYDTHMTASRQWYFYRTDSDTQYSLISFNFTGGVLTSIYTQVYQVG